ncbi:putative transposase [Xanthobacter flavus]|nr:putative transposase [Xanthobacter flavus]
MAIASSTTTWRSQLANLGESCCPNRVARLTRLAGIRAQIGYRRRPGHYGGKPSLAVDNMLDRRFDAEAPDKAWVTDITYIRTHEGFAYLAVVIDLFSRRVVGWSIKARQTTNVVLQALLAAVWRRKPKDRVLVHSDQGSQFTSMEWASFLKHHDLQPSMSRRGNCHDNAVAESFFNLLKRERIRRKVYRTRDEARRDVFDYIEMFYNPTRKHARNGMLSPIEFELRHKAKAEGVWKTRGGSVRYRLLSPPDLCFRTSPKAPDSNADNVFSQAFVFLCVSQCTPTA